MKMKLQLEWNISTRDWRSVLARCPQATFFHTPGWYQAMADRFSYTPSAVYARFDTGEEALLPLATRRTFKGLVVQACSGIEGGYGGWVSPDVLSTQQVEAAYRLVRARFPGLRVTGSPYERFNNWPLQAGQLTTDHTQAIALLSRDEQLRNMTRSRVKGIRKAEDDECYDIAIHKGLDEDDVRLFYPLYATHAAEWEDKRWVRDEAYFRALLRHCGENLALFMAYHEGDLAGFRLMGLTGPAVMALHVARAKDFSDSNVGPKLALDSMAWCRARGCQYVDLLPSGHLQSVRAYKATFGAADLSFGVARSVSLGEESLSGLSKLTQRLALEFTH